MYKIREMNESDWTVVSQIYQDGMNTNLATFEIDCPSYEKWDSSHLTVCRLVITKENQVVGFGALSSVSSRCVYNGVAEVSIYIDQNHRNKGIGVQLLNSIIQESERNAIWLLQSSIMQNNIASISLHEKCGFRRVGYREKIARDSLGEWRNTVLMEKRSHVENF